MTPVRLNAIVYGCITLLLGIAVIGTASAQAEIGANWMVNGANISNNTLLPEVQIKELENKIGTLLFTTKAGTKVKILCKEVHIVEAKLKLVGTLATLRMTGLNCTIDLNESESAACKPHSPGEAAGVIKSNALTGLAVLSEGTPVVLIKPETGTVLGKIELGVECAIGESLLVGGEFTVKDCQNEFAVEKVEHLIEQGPGTVLTALGQPASLDGSSIVKLSGAHTGLKFSGLPG